MDVRVNCDWQYYQQAVTKIWKILDIETYEQAKGKSVDELVADLKQQRDDLLAACRNLLIFSDCDSTCSDNKEAQSQAKAAIAKCDS